MDDLEEAREILEDGEFGALRRDGPPTMYKIARDFGTHTSLSGSILGVASYLNGATLEEYIGAVGAYTIITAPPAAAIRAASDFASGNVPGYNSPEDPNNIGEVLKSSEGILVDASFHSAPRSRKGIFPRKTVYSSFTNLDAIEEEEPEVAAFNFESEIGDSTEAWYTIIDDDEENYLLLSETYENLPSGPKLPLSARASMTDEEKLKDAGLKF